MKNLRQLCIALVFTLVFTLPTFAGDIETPIAPPPSSISAPVATGQIDTTVDGDIETGSSETTGIDSATRAALNLLQSVLSLF